MNKDAIVGLLRDNDKLVAAIVGAVITLCIASPIAFVAGALNYSVETRISRIEVQVKALSEQYANIVERGQLPASIERRLSEIERSLARIESRLDRKSVALESSLYGRTSNE